MKTDEWFVIKVVCKRTDHRLAQDTCQEIADLLKREGFEYQVDFEGWGSEAQPTATPRRIASTRPPR